MTVQIQSVKFDATEQLLAFVEGKLVKLDKFFDKIVSADVFLKLDKDHEHGNKVVTITLLLPGEELVAEARSRYFEEATDECVDALKIQIQKHKDRFVR